MKKIKGKGCYILNDSVFKLPLMERQQVVLLYTLNKESGWVGKNLINYYLNKVVPIRHIILEPELVPDGLQELRDKLKSLIQHLTLKQ